MNYHHAFHAGNFADCFKHALLVALLDALARKPAAFFVMDTHAGAGRYDLNSGPARRTGESDRGIGRLLQGPPPSWEGISGWWSSLGLYPGSPLLIRALLRAHDRLACCELHPEEIRSLRTQFRRDPQVTVHQRSGWEALGALLPPRRNAGSSWSILRSKMATNSPSLPTDWRGDIGVSRRGSSPHGIQSSALPRCEVSSLTSSLPRSGISSQLNSGCVKSPTRPNSMGVGCW